MSTYNTYGMIHILLDTNGKKNKLTYDLTDDQSKDAIKVYDALKGFVNEVNKRFPEIKMWIDYPHTEYPAEEGEDQIKTYPPCEK